MVRKKSKVKIPSDEEFRKIISGSKTYTECLKKLGLGVSGGGSLKLLKQRISNLGCSTDHFNAAYSEIIKPKYSLEEILVENSSYHNLGSLKKRLLEAEKLTYECEICGISEWMGQEISLHLDHINGINNDNRLENLRLLCPNCHSQTETYAGRNIARKSSKPKCERCQKQQVPEGEVLCTGCLPINKNTGKRVRTRNEILYSQRARKVKERPSKEALVNLLREHSFVAVGKMYGVSDNTVRKWCVYYGMSTKARDYK